MLRQDLGFVLTSHSRWSEVLRQRAEQSPKSPAFTFLERGETPAASLTFSGLQEHSHSVAAALREVARPGDRILLVYPPGLDFIPAFFGCLHAGLTAVPVQSPHPAMLKRFLPRLRAIARDCGAAALCTTEAYLSEIEKVLVDEKALPSFIRLATDRLPKAEVSESVKELAMLQYTSGSTADPRGVMLTHGNLLHNCRILAHALKTTPGDVGVHWLPFYHDMGLGLSILHPVFVGWHSVLMSPLSFLQSPTRWLSAINRWRATITCAPSFAYAHCADQASDLELKSLDLRSLDIVGNSADFIRDDVIDRFARRFEPCGFRREAFSPAYGLAEATMVVTITERGSPPVEYSVRRSVLERENRVVAATGGDEWRLVGCGRTGLETTIVIVDPKTRRRLPDERIGEIWVANPAVAKGYWKRAADSRRVFGAMLAGTKKRLYLRTGDLGFLRGGELFVTGRIKDVIILNGHNYYPEDIEETAGNSQSGLRPEGCCAFAVETGDEPRLVMAIELPRGMQKSPLDGQRETVVRAIHEAHQVRVDDVVWLRPRGIPRTSSGKFRRAACRDAYLKGTLERAGEGK